MADPSATESSLPKPTPSVNNQTESVAQKSVPLRKDLRTSAEAVRTHIRGGFLQAGREMLRMRPKCRRSEWLPYVEACGMTPRHAQKLMQATRAIAAGKVPPDLSLRGTLALIEESGRRRVTPPSSHTTVRTVPYTAVHEATCQRR